MGEAVHLFNKVFLKNLFMSSKCHGVSVESLILKVKLLITDMPVQGT